MNCVELRASLSERDDASGAEQQAHLRSCPKCSALIRDLKLISSTAVELRASEEPSPRVWNSIQVALRQEGLIRPRPGTRSLLPSFDSRRAGARWMAPAAATLLIVIGLYMHQRSLRQQLANIETPAATLSSPAIADEDVSIAGLNDNDLLQEVEAQSPGMQAQYADNLRRANQYIQDAKSVVAANPTDAEARRSLLEAYQQKAMLFELALDRSLP
jgi:hypothetical protein